MPVVRLVCWKEDLAKERARVLKAAGFSGVRILLMPSTTETPAPTPKINTATTKVQK
jgi:hypothetical protein